MSRKELKGYYIDVFSVSEYAEINRHNADFIESVVMIDSNYGKDLNPKEKGSTAWWFDQMKSPGSGYTYSDCINNIVESIDKVNSTHLEACEDGRTRMADRICDCCPTLDVLKEKLEKQFKGENTHLIGVLSQGMAVKKNENTGEERVNLSFATKFCAYAAKFLETHEQYSKYDSVVSKALPVYVEQYKINQDQDTKNFNINRSGKTLDQKLSIYYEYSKTIDAILTDCNSKLSPETQITKEEFDHIVWYTQKGK